MKLNHAVAGFAIFLAASVAFADDKTSTTTTTETTVQGEVVRVDAGNSIVVRKEGGEVVTYQLGPDVAVPVEAEVGKMVVLQTDRPNGTVVKRVTTSSVGPFTKRTEETEYKSGADFGGAIDTTTTYTVKAFEPGRTMTLVGPSGNVVTVNIDAESHIPTGIAIGKVVTIQTEDIGGRPMARQVVISKTTKTTTEVDD